MEKALNKRESTKTSGTGTADILPYAATESIPKAEQTRYLSKPWWSSELRAKNRREGIYQQYIDKIEK